jgi:uncharacterized protein
MTFKILSCDGGGIRGLITALLIQDLDKRSHIIERADGFAGTSTGGLLALALAHQVPIAEIIDIYRTKGQEIFKENRVLIEQREALQKNDTLTAPAHFECEYVNTGLKKIAVELLGNGNLADLPRFVAVNSARLWDPVVQSWMPCTFSNGSNNAYRGISLVDAALATSAAPSYFPPYEIAGLGYFADGGVFANNPSIAAVAEALASDRAGNLDNLRVLSLGTGTTPQGLTASAIGKPLSWGATKWLLGAAVNHEIPAAALLKLTLATTAELAAQQAKQILSDRYTRGNFALSQSMPMDDWKKVPEMEKETYAYMKTAEWQGVCQWVEQHWH